MTTETTDVATLARVANLQLSPERLAAADAVLKVWWRDANELSRKMSAPRYQGLAPATVFTPPHEATGESQS